MESTGKRIIETLHAFDLRDRAAVDRALEDLVDELQHALVVTAYLANKSLREIADHAVETFERTTAPWPEFRRLLASSLEERAHEGPR